MLAKTYGAAICGVRAMMVTVEVSVDAGVYFAIVGLPDSAVKESQQRIATALSQYGFHIPGKKVIVNMAPADIRKEGASHDHKTHHYNHKTDHYDNHNHNKSSRDH